MLDKEQAASLIVDGEDVAVERVGIGGTNVPGVLDRCEVFDLIRDGSPRFSGIKLRERGFGVTCFDLELGYIFIATKPDIDWEAEEAEAIHRMELKGGAT